jgi:dihydrolipoamide dehydrogenase
MVVGQVAEGRDLVVLGGGLGGYEAALRAAALGRTVMLVDRAGVKGLGGECLHRGCIPSKVLIERAHHDGFDEYLADRGPVVEDLRAAVERQVRRAGIEVVEGQARFLPGERIAIDRPGELPSFVQYRHAILATGSRPVEVPALPFGGAVLDAAGLLALDELPRSLAVVGGGAIGVELGTALARLGVAVTIVELTDRLLPGLDRDLGPFVGAALGALGVRVELGAAAVGHADGVLRLERDGAALEVAADRVLVAVGRRPNTDDVGIEATGAVLEAGGLVRTGDTGLATPRIAAVGDVRVGPALAHKAAAEGRMVAEVLSAVVGHRDVGAVPLIVFSDPEVASVGATAADAAASDGELVVGTVPLRASGRARTMGRSDGLVRLVAERTSGVILGAQVAAPHASELISTATVLVEMGAVLEDVDGMVLPHPTLGELFGMAAAAAVQASAA